MSSRLTALLLLSLPLAVACSSSESSGSSAATTTPAAFAKYCSGTLKVERPLERPTDGGGWETDDGAVAAPGTSILLSTAFGQYEGFVLFGDGRVSKVESDFAKGLVKDVDFTSDCAPATAESAHRFVVLAKTTLHPTADLAGEGCTIEPATEFESYGFSGGGSSITFQSRELEAKCGFTKGYAKQMVYASPIVR